MKFCQHQFIFALNYFIGRIDDCDYNVGQVLCEEPFICMFKFELGEYHDDAAAEGEMCNVPGDMMVTIFVEHLGSCRYVTNDWTYIDEDLQKVFSELGLPDNCGGHNDEICFADSPEYYLDAWPLRLTTWTEVQRRKYNE